MKHPKGLAVTFCASCNLVTFADHVSREDQIPHRFCSRCGGLLAVLVYKFERVLRSVDRAEADRAEAKP